MLPLSKKLGDKAMEIRNELAKDFMVRLRRRRLHRQALPPPGRDRHPAAASPWTSQTVGDDKTPADNCVTVRDRDTMEQVRMPISELKDYIAKKVAF